MTILIGSSGNDTLDGGNADDVIFGLGGNDRLTSGNGNDVMSGGGGIDQLYGGNGADTLDGGSGDDGLYGGDGADRMDGEQGNDTISCSGGNDVVDGGDGNDWISADSNSDSVNGGNGNDTILGGDALDSLAGAAGTDTLVGGVGADTLNGNGGSVGVVTIVGDVFRYDSINDTGVGAGRDIIVQFDDSASLAAQDLIDLSGIDANSGAAGDQSFQSTFLSIGDSFTAPRQIRIVPNGAGSTEKIIQLNTDGDAAVEAEILVQASNGIRSATSRFLAATPARNAWTRILTVAPARHRTSVPATHRNVQASRWSGRCVRVLRQRLDCAGKCDNNVWSVARTSAPVRCPDNPELAATHGRAAR
ncbi:MAG: hypothetical protein U1E14_12105 [Geminicoccaceae bacterium]